MKLIPLLALLALFACAAPLQAATGPEPAGRVFPADEFAVPFHFPVFEGWNIETIHFPLGFAPSIDYDGFEELRFAPGMFKVGQPDFWTYAFVWWVPTDTEITADILARDLDAYYRGLAAAVGEGKVAPEEITATKSTVTQTSPDDKAPLTFEGTIATFDAFASLTAITLNLQVEVIPCEAEDRLAVFFALSPQPVDNEIWTALHDLRKGFRCAP